MDARLLIRVAAVVFAAAAIAAEVGADFVRAEVAPGDKAAEVRRLQAEQTVTAMVGDGLIRSRRAARMLMAASG